MDVQINRSIIWQNIIDAILKLNPNAKVTVYGTDIDTCELIWNEDKYNTNFKRNIKSKIFLDEYISKDGSELK